LITRWKPALDNLAITFEGRIIPTQPMNPPGHFQRCCDTPGAVRAAKYGTMTAMHTELRSESPLARRQSVHDVERVAQGLVESSSGDLVEVTDWFVVEVVASDRDDVVAADDARFGESLLGADLDF
jgi:hypothetical protein